MQPEPIPFASRSAVVDATDVPWHAVPAHPVPREALRTLHYMQDIESHTIIYLRSLLATRAVDDPATAAFLACWFYEETFHGQALERFLAEAGSPVQARARSRVGWRERLHEHGIRWLARTGVDIAAVYMVWGAINELTTLTGYRRLSVLAGHPVLSELLARIIRDESRHFGFYLAQARARLAADARAQRLVRVLVTRFWAPVGTGVQPDAEVRFLAGYLFSGGAGLAAARKVDTTIRTLPGLADLPLLEAWLVRTGIAKRNESPRRSARPTATRRTSLLAMNELVTGAASGRASGIRPGWP